jgi:hypothetical protein
VRLRTTAGAHCTPRSLSILAILSRSCEPLGRNAAMIRWRDALGALLRARPVHAEQMERRLSSSRGNRITETKAVVGGTAAWRISSGLARRRKRVSRQGGGELKSHPPNAAS